jgi:R3H-associated N-terminal domain
MAALPPPQRAPTQFSDREVVETWARETVLLSLKNLHLSPATRASAGPNVDVDAPLAEADEAGAAPPRATRDPRRAELGRRDSLKRREALLKGKAGTRRRQRWENGALPLASAIPPTRSLFALAGF